MFWGTILLVGVLVAFAAVLLYARYMMRGTRNSAMQHTDMEALASYIKKAKAKEQEAWTNMLTVMGDENDELNSVYSPMDDTSLMGQSSTVLNEPNFMQKAFFSFWKVPPEKIPKTKQEANVFIERYKDKLKREGLSHRVRRWNRLELLMVKFCREFDVEELNEWCNATGLNKPILDILLDQVMDLLVKKKLSWKDVSGEQAYREIVTHLVASYPQLDIMQHRF